MMLALRLASRELRGGVRGLGVVLLCLALGVAAIAGVGGLRAAIEQGLAENGRALLGGDVEVQTGAEPPPAALIAWLRARGASVSEVTQMRSLLVAPSGRRELIDLKAVDTAWPLIGAAVLAPPATLEEALAPRDGRFGLVADPLVLDRLGLQPGDIARVGTAMFRVAAALVSEPDRAATPSLFGAPAVIAAAALPSTSLMMPGAIVTHAVRAAWADPASAAGQAAALAAAFPDRGWRVRGPADAAPGVERFVTQTALFMTLVGLTALLVGGVGVASGVRAWLEFAGTEPGHTALSWRFLPVGVRGRRDAGGGAGAVRHRDRAGGRRGHPAAGRAFPGRRAAGAAARRAACGFAGPGGVLWGVDCILLRPAALGARHAHPRRGAVPRRADPRGY